MFDKEAMIRRIDEMPIDELQNMICKALDDSGIAYQMGPGGMSLSDFFDGILTDEGTTEALEISGKSESLTARYISPDSDRASGPSFSLPKDYNSFDWDHNTTDFAA